MYQLKKYISNDNEKAFPIQLPDRDNISLSLLTNERAYLRTADEDDDTPFQNDANKSIGNRDGNSTTSSKQNDSLLYSYTLNDLKDIVKYASDRGITVIPEIDMPAHTL